MTSPSSPQDNGFGGSVTVHLPDAREQVWSSTESAMKRWRIGDLVVFRNAHWRVVARDDSSESLTLTLAVPD